MTQHAFDAVSFAFGALFLIAGVMLLSGTPNADAMQWLGPTAAHRTRACSSWSPRCRAGGRMRPMRPTEDEPMGDGSEA